MHRLTRKRTHDYGLLILSLALILTGYGLVTGCFPTDIQTGVVRPEAIDGDRLAAKDPDGVMKIPITLECVRASLMESACEGCSKIQWEIESTGELPTENVTLLNNTLIKICRPSDFSIKKAIVTLFGEYTKPGVVNMGTPTPIPQTTMACIPVRFET